jgi:diphthamide biosynthesis protein 7
MSEISSVYSTVLELPPSCIEFWPTNPNYFVVGTYHLERGTGQTDDGRPETAESEANVNDTTEGDSEAKQQNRDGSIILFNLSNHVV